MHPPCKDPFGIRLANLALKLEYSQNIVARAPTYNASACSVAANTISVVFGNVAEGLESSAGALAEWELAGADGKYVPASAEISGLDTVQVWSPAVPAPVSARYAFSTNPAENNLVNSAGLPASPIREVTPGVNPSVCGDDAECCSGKCRGGRCR